MGPTDQLAPQNKRTPKIIQVEYFFKGVESPIPDNIHKEIGTFEIFMI